MPALRGQGNADDPATMYTVTHGERREQMPGEWNNEVVSAALVNEQWLGLLLRAVLNGWRIASCGRVVRFDHKQTDFSFEVERDITNGLPACPDAETYERIRKAVDGA